jgi:hypothetical protein
MEENDFKEKIMLDRIWAGWKISDEHFQYGIAWLYFLASVHYREFKLNWLNKKIKTMGEQE